MSALYLVSQLWQHSARVRGPLVTSIQLFSWKSGMPTRMIPWDTLLAAGGPSALQRKPPHCVPVFLSSEPCLGVPENAPRAHQTPQSRRCVLVASVIFLRSSQGKKQRPPGTQTEQGDLVISSCPQLEELSVQIVPNIIFPTITTVIKATPVLLADPGAGALVSALCPHNIRFHFCLFLLSNYVNRAFISTLE